eukprot:5733653-Prymnesium_polylepis.1
MAVATAAWMGTVKKAVDGAVADGGGSLGGGPEGGGSAGGSSGGSTGGAGGGGSTGGIGGPMYPRTATSATISTRSDPGSSSV